MIYPFSHNSKLHTSKKQDKHVNSFKHGWLVGWLDASNQWTTVFSKMIKVRMWRMFLSGAALEWSSSIRTLSCVKGYGYVCWYLIILSAYDYCNRILGMVLYLHYYSQNVPSNKKTFEPSGLRLKKETYIYINISRTSNFKKTSEHFDTFWVNSSSPMMPMVWYWSYPQLGKAANRQWPFVPVCSPIHSDLQAYDYKWNLHTKKWKANQHKHLNHWRLMANGAM